MFKNTSRLVGVLIISLLSAASPAQARENVTDWYIQDLRAEFVLSADSTMVVTEWIVADCGQCVGKHGIFRVVPTEARTGLKTIETPVELLSITDFDGKKYAYTETKNRSDGTVTWKIGDPDKTVQGVNRYKIAYAVKNVIRPQETFDEFYWNIGGNFWELDIDAFAAIVVFPEEVQKRVLDISTYAGVLGSKASDALAQPRWQDEQTLAVAAVRMLAPGEGVTLSVSVPQGIFTLYQFGFWEVYGKFFWLLLPLGVFVGCYKIWKRFGDDPAWDKVVIPEYEVPEHLDALELGVLSTNGTLKNEFVTAGIIELGVRGALKIREEKNKVLFFTLKEYILDKISTTDLKLSSHQSLLLEKLFESGDTVKLSDLKNKFHAHLGELQKKVIDSLATKGLIEKKGLSYRVGFLVLGGVVIFLVSPVFGAFSSFGGGAVLFAACILFIFGLIMPKRTLLGVETNWRIRGLKLYMETAEKHRQQFYEKENIFETLLPYAIVFGMTKEWIGKMNDIYGAEYFSKYHPAWFVASDMGSFDANYFTSSMESLSSSIAANTGTSSGSSGSGSSGGGGGGGGGGGW